MKATEIALTTRRPYAERSLADFWTVDLLWYELTAQTTHRRKRATKSLKRTCWLIPWQLRKMYMIQGLASLSRDTLTTFKQPASFVETVGQTHNCRRPVTQRQAHKRITPWWIVDSTAEVRWMQWCYEVKKTIRTRMTKESLCFSFIFCPGFPHCFACCHVNTQNVLSNRHTKQQTLLLSLFLSILPTLGA